MEIPRHWRLKAQRYRLEGAICPSCGELIFPPRPVCTKCQRSAQLMDINDWIIPASMNTSDIESRIKYEITERMIG